jgi:putative tricarboxylic transport membrane protein
MNFGQLLAALIWFGIGVAIAVGAYNLGIGALGSPGPGLFAFLIGMGMASLALSVAVNAVRTEPATGAGMWPQRAGAISVVIAALAFYTLTLERIGFFLSTFLFLLALLGTLSRASWMATALASVGITLGSYLVFAKLLKISLPAGALGF